MPLLNWQGGEGKALLRYAPAHGWQRGHPKENWINFSTKRLFGDADGGDIGDDSDNDTTRVTTVEISY